MSNFFVRHFFGLIIIGLLALFLTRQLPYSPTSENSSEEYKADKSLPVTFIPGQTIIIRDRYGNTGVTVFRSVNVGVSEEGLHLSQPILNMIFLPSLISWDELKYQRPIKNDNEDKAYTFYLDNSPIVIRLYSSTIEQLEQDYGEPIFSNKLVRYCQINKKRKGKTCSVAKTGDK